LTATRAHEVILLHCAQCQAARLPQGFFKQNKHMCPVLSHSSCGNRVQTSRIRFSSEKKQPITSAHHLRLLPLPISSAFRSNFFVSPLMPDPDIDPGIFAGGWAAGDATQQQNLSYSHQPVLRQRTPGGRPPGVIHTPIPRGW
jgi:hypothetical protein